MFSHNETVAKASTSADSSNSVMPRNSFTVCRCGFTASADGKLVAGTKYRVRWRVGFFDGKILDDSVSREDRGTVKEHEVTFVWSVTSGKRLILVDSNQVHFSVHRGQRNFNVTWNMGGNFMSIVAHAIQPLNQDKKFRQFDLLINGDSFFLLPEVHEVLKNKRISTKESAMDSSRGSSTPVSGDYIKMTSPVIGGLKSSNDTKSTCSSSTPSSDYRSLYQTSPSAIAAQNLKNTSFSGPFFV